MDYDSESSCEGRFKNLETSDKSLRLRQANKTNKLLQSPSSVTWNSTEVAPLHLKLKANVACKSLSSQVMEYYQKYSQNSNLDQYFSLPSTSKSPDADEYSCGIYELNAKVNSHKHDYIGEECNFRSYVPRERRRWVRPPLIGQSSSVENTSHYGQPIAEIESSSPDSKDNITDAVSEEKPESQNLFPEVSERKTSPTSSIASHKPLEWDSGADVGYFNTLPQNKNNNKKLSTIERMALARGCSAALRLDPEGTTEVNVPATVLVSQGSTKIIKGPDANSTPLVENISGSESEIEITPIMKSHLPGIITGNDIKSEEKNLSKNNEQNDQTSEDKEVIHDTPKSTIVFKVPNAKQPMESKKLTDKISTTSEGLKPFNVLLKKSTSMNTLAAASKFTLKRSQSELNLYANEKNKILVPLIFNSTSSIATVVNKPSTCDKVIQTSMSPCSQESVGIQVSVVIEKKPPLPKRGTSLQKSLNSILKNPKGTYRIQNSKSSDASQALPKASSSKNDKDKTCPSSSDLSQNGSRNLTPQPDEGENITGRANSFEYFPGHVYENVPNGSSSHVSSVDTGKSNSTIPNTSSSIDEKLWGDSDSLVRDLERSVNILRSLVDANKCDKNVKKRLIHHVVKRLVTAKYTDDKIEHNLEDNVPWNPDDARKKVYRTEILQALTKKHSTTDSSDEWKPQTKAKNECPSKSMKNDRDAMENVVLDSSNSDKFDQTTDRTEMDGRKARMGLRVDDCRHTSNSPTDPDKSESSECFFPQRNPCTSTKAKNMFCLKEKCKLRHGESTTTNSSPPDQNRLLLDAVVNNRRTPVESSNMENNVDWRLPTTLSERQYELKRCRNSDSDDSKLVNYAEMEKRNQLIWITNEISHLSNLKKLLEQPRKIDRTKSSPRKSKQSSRQRPHAAVFKCVQQQTNDSDYVQRTASDTQENRISEQWSSHCNLAPNSFAISINNDNYLQRLGKRNSSSQTATNVCSAQSRTGGEIVSAIRKQSNSSKSINTGTQTSIHDIISSPTMLKSDILYYVPCPVHQTIAQKPIQTTDCALSKCTQCSKSEKPLQVANCSCRGAVVQYQTTQSIRKLVPSDSNSSICSKISDSSSNHFKQKETKNQINASKSKCVCDYKNTNKCSCISDCRCEVNSIDFRTGDCKKLTTNTCQICSKEIPTTNAHSSSHWTEQRKKTVQCTCSSDRENENKKCNRIPTEHQIQFMKNDSKEITPSCRCSEIPEKAKPDVSRNKNVCDYCINGKTSEHHENSEICTKSREQTVPRQSHFVNQENKHSQRENTQSNLCNCDNDCLNISKVNRHHVNKESTSTFNEQNKNCQYCCACGKAYKNAKKCNCQYVYPKSVAYEISFNENSKDNSNTSNFNANKNSYPSTSAKINSCGCEKSKVNVTKKNRDKTNTLQDYLYQNKPEFLDNAETRRQYMYEISHLRELRKQKRNQLLAMADSSLFLKSPKSHKTTAPKQIKISDREMKERLRKRYQRLSEVRNKRREQEKQEEARRNNLMAKIFCKKLQQKVLKGQVDLSQSISVISNL